MQKKIDLNLLRIFDTVMSEMSVTRAAHILRMSQPAVSNALNRLRYLMDDDLFVKNRGIFSATPKAKIIWPDIHDSLIKLELTLNQSNFDPTLSTATIRFGMSDFIASQTVIPLYADLEKIAPNINMHLLPHNIEQISDLLENGDLDMAAGVHRTFDNTTLRTATIGSVKYVCAMRRNHSLTKAKLDREAFLAARHLVVSTSGRQGFIDRQLDEQGLKRKIGLIVNNFALAPSILLKTDLISVLPENTIKSSNHIDELAVAPLPVPITPGIIRLAWHARTENIPVHRWIREALFRLCKSKPE